MSIIDAPCAATIPQVTVRPAVQEDIEAIAEITKDAFERYAAELGLPDRVTALKETREDILRDLKDKHIFIGLLEGKPVGSIRYHMLPNNIAYISRFGVRSEAENFGIGKALIQAVEVHCREHGVDAIVLHTSSKMMSLMRFYYTAGYYVQETRTDRGYIRALLCHPVCADCKTFDLMRVYQE